MSYNPTGIPYRKIGLDGDQLTVGTRVGGDVAIFTANGVLKVGDIVYVSAANTVSKSNTDTDYVVFAGVVVGSVADLGGFIVGDDSVNAVGASLTSGTQVWVQFNGIAWVVADAAITVGTRLGQGATTAGRVDDIAFAAGKMVGVALQAATNAGDKLQMLIQPK